MWVFGDGELDLDTRQAAERLVALWRALDACAPGIERHTALVTALVELGMLLQGVADGRAAEGAPVDEAEGLLLGAGTRLARAVAASRGSRGHAGALGEPGELEAWLASRREPRTLRVRVPEGYAFYALYPELYAEAARAFARAHGGRAFVIGLRSIGTSLACSAAAGLDQVCGLFTTRPTGPAFARRAALEEPLARAVAADGAPVLVVDEGPGLSGSTLASVADALEASGVARPRIHFLPGHTGELGPRAGPSQRARWQTTPKHVVRFDDAIVEEHARWPLSSWFEPSLGEAEGPLEDLSGGAWRARVVPRSCAPPPANVSLERRKYVLRTRSGTYLLKFAGIGPFAEQHERRARFLAESGLVPRVVARAHGFLATEWREGVPLSCAPETSMREVAEVVGSYLAVLRAQPPRARGATPADLLRMMERNTELALGPEHARAIERWRSMLGRVDAEARAIAVDARMHAWEWLVTSEGGLVKTDAFDHHAGHDLVGCQDLAWDVAGALVELARTPTDREALLEAFARRGIRYAAELRAFYEAAYLAFQLGAARTGADMLGATAPDDAARFAVAADAYAGRLARLLHEA